MSIRPGAPARSLGWALGILCVATGTGWSHDFWIEPETYTPAVGASVPIRLRVGTRFSGEIVPLREDRIEWFAAIDSRGERPLRGGPGADPAGTLRIETAGLHLIGYRGRQSFIELNAKQFEDYLAEEGLGRISALRASRGQTRDGARELYSRCAKSLLAAGGAREGSQEGYDRVLGFPLELVPESNPYALAGGGGLWVRLLYNGSPLEGSRVEAINQADPRVTASGQTDAQGRVRLTLARHGAWLVKTIHMIESPTRDKADWESLWATLTFEAPARVSR